MNKVLNAIRFRNLDEAREVLREVSGEGLEAIFDDDGAEPQGLLAVAPEDLVGEEVFVRLFGQKKGASVQVERIEYSGYGPPAEECDYMGFVSRNVAYVLPGSHIPIEITNCPLGARDIHHLEAMVIDDQHPLERDILAAKLELRPGWDFEDLFELLSERSVTADEIDAMIHRCVH